MIEADAVEPEEPVRYRVQITEQALSEIRQAWEYSRLEASEDVADDWEESLKRAILSLQVLPHRYALMSGRAFRSEVRHYMHRRKAGTTAYHVLYCIKEENEPVVMC